MAHAPRSPTARSVESQYKSGHPQSFIQHEFLLCRKVDFSVNATRKTEQGFSNSAGQNSATELRPCQGAVNTTRKPSRGLATRSKFLRLGCDSVKVANATRKPSRGLATAWVKIWCDRADSSKCCRYHTKPSGGLATLRVILVRSDACQSALNTTKTEQGLVSESKKERSSCNHVKSL